MVNRCTSTSSVHASCPGTSQFNQQAGRQVGRRGAGGGQAGADRQTPLPALERPGASRATASGRCTLWQRRCCSKAGWGVLLLRHATLSGTVPDCVEDCLGCSGGSGGQHGETTPHKSTSSFSHYDLLLCRHEEQQSSRGSLGLLLAPAVLESEPQLGQLAALLAPHAHPKGLGLGVVDCRRALVALGCARLVSSRSKSTT